MMVIDLPLGDEKVFWPDNRKLSITTLRKHSPRKGAIFAGKRKVEDINIESNVWTPGAGHVLVPKRF